jgi:beta-glucosidase
MSFPRNFVWGSASSSFQIEGNIDLDGKGLSIWDVFCQTPGRILLNHSPEITCNHYQHYKEDVALMKEIGLQSYRFSLAWPRMIPTGIGSVNAKGLDFYDRLIDELLGANITPFIELYHWDLPQALQEQGGWLNRDISNWFADYTEVATKKFGDRVQQWLTLNEIQNFIGNGYGDGASAPGEKGTLKQVLTAGHNALLAHGKAVQIIRKNVPHSLVGWAPTTNVGIPATDKPMDVQAARNFTLSVTEKNWFNTAWWMDPVYFGKYPQSGLEVFGNDVPEIHPGDMETICQPLDFFGCNIYYGKLIRADDLGRSVGVSLPYNCPLTLHGAPVMPESIYWGTTFFSQHYQLPMYIFENGISNPDWISLDGKVHDPQRIDFIKRYLIQLERAIKDGAKVCGYFYWSIMDNFEYTCGYKERYGLIYVDYSTQERTLKDSAVEYGHIIKTNGEALNTVSPEVREYVSCRKSARVKI